MLKQMQQEWKKMKEKSNDSFVYFRYVQISFDFFILFGEAKKKADKFDIVCVSNRNWAEQIRKEIISEGM